MILNYISVIPEVFPSYLHSSILGRALTKGYYQYACYNLRSWAYDKHKTVDDKPYGGGQGMLMSCLPVARALDDIAYHHNKILRKQLAQADHASYPHVVFFSPHGKPFTQHDAMRLSSYQRIVFVCGRYEGFDERVYDWADDIISLGDYILTGAELPALTISDSLIRLIPGVLGDELSNVDESFSFNGILEHAQYTRPYFFDNQRVPDVLLSGNHKEISAWKRKSALRRTAQSRPDLLNKENMSSQEYAWLVSQGYLVDNRE